MRARQARRALLVAAVAACGPPPPGATTAVAPTRAHAGSLLREDMVTITRGTVVRAVGVSRRYVYAVTGDAVVVYDRDFRAWQPPFGRDGGFDPAMVRAVATDPDDDSAWLLTATGAWTLQPLTAFVTRAPAGPLPSRLRVGALDAIYREFPSLQSFGRLLTRDQQSLQSFPVVAGARAPDRTEVWLGTAGGGLYQVDPLFNRADARPQGLAASGAGAIARAADGVWIAPASRGVEARVAITFASRDLQQWRWIDDGAGRAFGAARSTAIDVAGGTLWMGTTRGLYRVPLDGDGARAFSAISGLPSDVVLSVLARNNGVWVGTAAGLAFLPADSAAGAEIAMNAGDVHSAVSALLATGDTLWIGTGDGLLLRPPGERAAFVRPAGATEMPRLRQPVHALARADSLVLAAIPNGVLAFNLLAGRWSEPWPAAPWQATGSMDVLAADARAVWAGGPSGVVATNRRSGDSRILRVGSDLPDAVTGIVLDGDWAWIATLGGVVRVRRPADGLFP